MKFMPTIKIGTRLYALVVLILSITTITAIAENVGRQVQIEGMQSLLTHHVAKFQLLDDINVTAGNLFLSHRNYFLEYPDQEKMQVRLNDINNRTDFILTNLKEYEVFLQQRNAPQDELQLVQDAINKINTEVLPFNKNLIGLVQSGKMAEAQAFITSKEARALRSSLQDDLLSQIVAKNTSNAELIMNANIQSSKEESFRILVLLVFSGILVIFISWFIIRSIVSPIKDLTALSHHIADGDFEFAVTITSKNEIGILANNFLRVKTILHQLMSSINKMAAEQTGGDYDAYIDCSQFNGAYRTVAFGINEMIKEYVDDILSILGTVSGCGSGDFNVPLKKYPGKKAVTNTAVEKLRETFKELSSEISILAVSASKGDLSKSIDSSKFEGSWVILSKELNGLLSAITEPINESSLTLAKMAEGDFSTKMTGDYSGDFAIIKNSLNATQDAISSYISEISTILGEMSKQNLNVSIDRKYIGDFSVIKDAINKIIETFNTVLFDINATAGQVAIGSKQISDAGMKLSQGATEQAGSVQELNRTIEQVTTQTLKNMNIADKANALSNETKESAEMGNAEMKEMLSAMKEINESSDNISKVIKVIEDIAFQTNLLALNAAVEAARAGEHGKGFAVVAEEVRDLATRSQLAAKDTTALIENSVQKASKGTSVANGTAKTLKSIVDKISEVSEHISLISEASKEQNASLKQIQKGITEVACVTQENTAISEENAASAEELSNQAEIFKNAVAEFKLK